MTEHNLKHFWFSAMILKIFEINLSYFYASNINISATNVHLKFLSTSLCSILQKVVENKCTYLLRG